MLFLSISESKHGEDGPHLLAADLLCVGLMVRTHKIDGSISSARTIGDTQLMVQALGSGEKPNEHTVCGSKSLFVASFFSETMTYVTE
jgi:hypothetical protein